MKLFYSKGSCSLSIRIVLHELNLPCFYESVDLLTKRTEKGRDFFTINPKGCVPVLELDDQQILTECSVIMQYLTDQNKGDALLTSQPSMDRYRILEWLSFIGSDLHKSCSPLFYPQISNTTREGYLIPRLIEKLNYLDHHLGRQRYLIDDHFTLPDAYLFVICTWFPYFKIEIHQWKNLSLYFSELSIRPSIQMALKEEGLIKT